MYRIGMITLVLVSLFLLPGVARALVLVHTLESPNKVFKIEILLGPIDQTWGYVYFKGTKILTLHNLGFQLSDGEFVPTPLISKEFIERLRTEDVESHTNVWKRMNNATMPYPKVREIRRSEDYAEDNARGFFRPVTRDVSNPAEPEGLPEIYNESVVEYKGLMKIVFRAYDEGIAFCYEFETEENEPIKIKRELTLFAFEGDYPCWTAGSRESLPLSKIEKGYESPLLVEIPDGPAISLSENRLADFAPMKLLPSTERGNALIVSLSGEVEIPGTGKPYRSPWRLIKWPPVLPATQRQ